MMNMEWPAGVVRIRGWLRDRFLSYVPLGKVGAIKMSEVNMLSVKG